jgi:hypothetical protein
MPHKGPTWLSGRHLHFRNHLQCKMGRPGPLSTTETRHELHRTQPTRRARTRVILATTVAALVWISWAGLGTHWALDGRIHQGESVDAARDNELAADWDLIEPSEELHWVPCFRALDDFLCARLAVPMDYNRPINQSTPFAKSHPKVHIALIMLPGKNHTKSGAWSDSPLLVNPGGPGGSGTSIVMLAPKLGRHTKNGHQKKDRCCVVCCGWLRTR